MIRARRLDPLRPVVYLDYDGVLHSDEVYWYRKRGIVLRADYSLFAAAGVLESILAPYWICLRQEKRMMAMGRYLKFISYPKLYFLISSFFSK